MSFEYCASDNEHYFNDTVHKGMKSNNVKLLKTLNNKGVVEESLAKVVDSIIRYTNYDLNGLLDALEAQLDMRYHPQMHKEFVLGVVGNADSNIIRGKKLGTFLLRA